jgi:hypothetical protein
MLPHDFVREMLAAYVARTLKNRLVSIEEKYRR